MAGPPCYDYDYRTKTNNICSMIPTHMIKRPVPSAFVLGTIGSGPTQSSEGRNRQRTMNTRHKHRDRDRRTRLIATVGSDVFARLHPSFYMGPLSPLSKLVRDPTFFLLPACFLIFTSLSFLIGALEKPEFLHIDGLVMSSVGSGSLASVFAASSLRSRDGVLAERSRGWTGDGIPRVGRSGSGHVRNGRVAMIEPRLVQYASPSIYQPTYG